MFVCVQLSSLEEELRVSREGLERAEQKGRSLEQRVQELELEVEAKARAKDERSWQIKLLEVRSRHKKRARESSKES